MKRIESYSEYIWKLDYREKPRSVDQLLDDPAFFGKLTNRGKAVYPVWRETLNELLIENSKWLAVFTGAIGTGKSWAAVAAMCMIMHHVLCLKDPWGFFELASGGKMAIAFFNLKQTLSKSKGYDFLQTLILSSTWFRDRGIVSGVTTERLDFPLFEFLLASPYARGFGTIGEDIFLSLMDEVDSPTESINQKMRVMKAYEAGSRRFESRFVIDGESLGKVFLVASKQSELSFLNVFVDKMKNSPEVYIKDIPVWEAKPQSRYSGRKFKIMLGDVYVPPRIVEDEKDVVKATRAGYEILEVPVEYERDFQRDIVGSLRDIAGRAIEGERKTKLFPSRKSVLECFDVTKKDPVTRETIEIGLKDDVDLLKFIDFSLIHLPRHIPRNIHEDIAFSSDALSLAMSGVKTWKDVTRETDDGVFVMERLPVIQTDFVLRLKARPGDRIPLNKVRKLVIDLKKVKRFNIIEFTADLRLASEDTMQILDRSGIPCRWLSLDKTPQCYTDFRDLVYEQRWTCHPHGYLNFELVNLEVDPSTGKIDHPEEVKEVEFLEDGSTQDVVLKGSKDVADGVVGSVVGALTNCTAPPDLDGMKSMLDTITKTDAQRPEDVMERFVRMNIEKAGKKDVTGSDGKISKDDAQTFADLLKKL